ncbi:MAG: acyltransferase family protein [Prevotella sp.]|nr:acyltransferase family protein [Prevotella sp.]
MNQNSLGKPEREYWIDAVRSFACLCVITTHAPIPNGSSGAWIIPFYNYMAVGGASILFFMISGALILYKEKPVIPFLKTRLTRIFFPMVVWTIITLLWDYAEGSIDAKTLLYKTIHIPFGPQVGVYWFIYDVFGIYLLTPILASWLSRCSRKDVLFYLFVWGFTLLLPYLRLIDPLFDGLTDYTSGYLYHFYGYLGFAVLGYYLRRYVSIAKVKPVHLLLSSASVLFLFIAYYFTNIPHSVVQDRLGINIVCLAISYFLVIKHLPLPHRSKHIFYDFAQHSFGIYLVHLLVMRRILWPLLADYDVNYMLQIPLITLLTAGMSYLVVHILSKLPYSKYFIGL